MECQNLSIDFSIEIWAISTGFDVSFKNRSDNLNLKCDNDV